MGDVKYRLPESLGGGEVEPAEVFIDATGPWPDHRVVKVPDPAVGAWFVLVPKDALTEVKSEPPPGYYVLNVGNGVTFACEHEEGYGWHVARDARGFMWAEMCERWPDATYDRLVPDPFAAEPVSLPWKHKGIEVQRTSTDSGPGHHVHVSTKGASYGFAHLTPDVAREMARALIAAADQAESGQR